MRPALARLTSPGKPDVAIGVPSARTLAPRLSAEIGLSFGQLRRQARPLAALFHLTGGAAAMSVALDLCYGSPSALIAMFKRALGSIPGRYFA